MRGFHRRAGRWSLLLALLGGIILPLPLACEDDDGPMERAGKSADEALEEAGDDIEDALEEAGDAVEDATD